MNKSQISTIGRLVALFALTCWSIGCGDSEEPNTGESTGTESTLNEAELEEETGVTLGTEEDFGPFIRDDGFIEDNSISLVISSVSFDLQPEEGISDGFNLDGVTSDETDNDSCGHPDQISIDGEEGIDNKVASIFWIFKDLYGPQINDLLSNAIQEGRLLVIMELLGVDDPLNDDNVTLRWFRGAATPQIGFSGQLLSSQTFYVDESMETSIIEGATIKDSRFDYIDIVSAEGDKLTLHKNWTPQFPIPKLNVSFCELLLHEGRFAMQGIKISRNNAPKLTELFVCEGSASE